MSYSSMEVSTERCSIKCIDVDMSSGRRGFIDLWWRLRENEAFISALAINWHREAHARR